MQKSSITYSIRQEYKTPNYKEGHGKSAGISLCNEDLSYFNTRDHTWAYTATFDYCKYQKKKILRMTRCTQENGLKIDPKDRNRPIHCVEMT